MQESSMELQWRSSQLSGGNASYVEQLYESYLADPNTVPEPWRNYFEQLPRVNGRDGRDVAHSAVREQFVRLGQARRRGGVAPAGADSGITEHERKQVRVVQLISAYRQRGHQQARLDPLQLTERPPVPDLELGYHQLGEADLDTVFQCGNLHMDKDSATLRDIVAALEQTYCNTVGAEFMHIVATEERRWIQQRMESVRSRPSYGPDTKRHLLERLIAAEGLEKSLAAKYPGVKRFGLEGGESLIPMVDTMIQRCGAYGTKEIVLGMAHRGRLNVLVNLLGKKPADLFDEFEGRARYQGSSDVKYHQGFSSNVMTPGGEVHLAMAFNPSHLEIVSPVVEGSVRARQDRREDVGGDRVVPIVMHGDAAFAGQGVVMETFQMSQTRGYGVGGTIHIVINNQVGFTTSDPRDARSTEYCTDVAKMVQAPVFHVNGDDPEAVLFVSQMAVDFRREFKKDVVIDLVCYRRRGHNEADEPSATQPKMYQVIRSLPSTRDLYARQLIEEGILAEEEDTRLVDEYRQALEEGNHVANSLVKEPNKALFVDWSPYLGHDWHTPYDSQTPLKHLQELAARASQVPDHISLQRQVARIYEDRRKMAAGGLPINWGFAETLAYATLLDAGHPVRLTGQDVGRGTFSHRHAVVYDQESGERYIPLASLSPEQPRFSLYDSLLSEEAALAFEYGYATTTPGALVIWEAQFGDFANGAQVVIDQFITSGEAKWGRLCGLTLLLPHGYEGQGPEHSSARLERFLQSCAEHNIQVCIPSTPAQIYHLLRRQAIRPLRKPLVIMSPKSLLRHKEVASSLEELANGDFQYVLADPDIDQPERVERLILCSGKVFYDLRETRREQGIDDIAILRIEQLYPFPEEELGEAMARYGNLKEVFWCQEEPMNQGAWYSSQHHMRRVLHRQDESLYLQYVGREPAAAPAAGYMALHLEQQERFIRQALKMN